ncbi:MAG: serine--tRNA ligase [Alphaproteobacteria bacterium]
MLDLKWIRDNRDALDRDLERRGEPPLAGSILDLDARCREAKTRLQEIQARRNEASKRIGEAKFKGEEAAALIAEMGELKGLMRDSAEAERALDAELESLLATVPNLLADEVPDGADESANEEAWRHGEHPRFEFQPRQHFEIGEALGQMHLELAAQLSGARFVVLTGPLARLERALAQFMLDLHTGEFGYGEVHLPYLVRDHVLYGTGQLPKFGDDQFRTTDGYWLIPTGEVPLTNLVADKILDAAELPLRFAACTPCFRAEAGAAGKDTRGMLRQHQFTKVELVSIVHPNDSWDELERMTCCAEEVLRRLGLHYRVVVLSSGDTGFAARKTYDIEVWLPGQDTYREISSCSNCGDYQARRMKARFRPDGGRGTRFVHTLNGSGLAVGRTLIAVLENYQEADGSVTVPEALRPYMDGLERIAPDG